MRFPVAEIKASNRQSQTRSVVVRLAEEEYEFLKAAAASRGTRTTMATALRSCVSWMIRNLDADLWDDALKPAKRGRESPQSLSPITSLLSQPDGRFEAWKDEQQAIEMLLVESAYPGDRRSCRRYPIQLDVKARPLGDASAVITGTTLNISSMGVLLVTREPIELDAELSLWIDWPLPSVRGKPLRLWSRGKIVWRSGDLAGVRIRNWLFRERPGGRRRIPTIQ